MIRATALAVTTALLLAAGGCGYAPHSDLGESYEAVKISVRDRTLRRELSDYLEGKGVAVTDAAQLELEIDGEESESIVSLTSVGTANKLRLSYRVRISMSRGGQEVRKDRFVLREVMTYNESRLLAKRKERRSIFKSMRASALNRIWSRVRQEIRQG